jgi:hypothetical protein
MNEKNVTLIKRTRLLTGVTWLALALATTAIATAQHAPPGCELYLADIVHDGSTVKVSTPVQVTDRKGYDGQPAFSLDGKSLYYIVWELQSDVWVMDVATKKHRAYRETPNPEYSPTTIPGDPDGIALVRQDGPKHQIWQYASDTAKERTALLPGAKQAIFFAWNGDDILYVRPPILYKAKVGGADKGEVVTRTAGRTLKRVPGTKDILFTDAGMIKRLVAASGKIEPVMKTLPKIEDFAVAADGTLWTSDGKALFMAAAGEETWKKVADLSKSIPKNISRLDINAEGTLIALVGDE